MNHQHQEIVNALTVRQSELAEKIMQRGMATEAMRKYSDYQLQKSKQDIIYNLEYLAQALHLESDSLWEDYTRWLKFLLLSLGLDKRDIAEHFSVMSSVLAEEPDLEIPQKVWDLLDFAQKLMLDSELYQALTLKPENPYLEQAEQYKSFLLGARKHEALQYIQKLADEGIGIRNIYLDILQPVQREIGNLWHANKISVAQEHYCTGLTQLAIAQLYPRLFTASPKKHSMIATCVSGELHEIGLRMVTDIMELDGWDTTYLGANMPNESIVKSIAQGKADLVAISVTYPLNLHKAEQLIAQIREDASLSRVKIMVGGYPFLSDPTLWQKIGADSFATDASLAGKIAANLVENSA
jgi:MerR family transcriptional regulator, light-induced transcriptional regulator